MRTTVNKFTDPSLPFAKAILPFLLFALCFITRFIYVSAQDICIDEPFSIYHAQYGVGDIIRFLKPTNNPPLFEILLHFWIKTFGISVLSVRFLPVLFSALAVIYIYKTGMRFFSVGVGVIASLLYVFSSHSIYYAHDCRVYSLFVLLTAMSLYFTAKMIGGRTEKKNLILLCIVNTLLVYSHYFGFIVWFIEFLFLFVYLRTEIKNVFLVFLGAGVLYLPQFINLANRFMFSTTEGTWVKEPNGLDSIYNMLWKFSNMPIVTVACILIVLASIILFFVKQKNEETSKIKIFVIGSFFLPFIMMFLVSYKMPVFNGRYLTFLLPSYYLMIAVLVTDLIPVIKFKYVLPGLLVLLFSITVDPDPDKKREAKAAVDHINAIKRPGDLVIICTHEFLTNYAYYTDKELFKVTGGNEYGNLEKELKSRNIYAVRKIDEVEPSLISNSQRIIYLDAGADFSNPGNNVLNTLNSKFERKTKKHFKEIFDVYEFNNRTPN